jgi:crotonobetainyl-CoA:carnitine CoA-transferase CaiB-like acyl-CoA transferase
MMMANAYANADDMLAYADKPERPTVDAGLHGLGACYRLYKAADGWVFLAIATDAEWQRFAAAVERRWLANDPRFERAEQRRSNDSIVADTLEELFAGRSAEAWERLLVPARVGCVRVAANPGAFLMSRPDLTAEVEHLRFGNTRRWGPLVVCNGGPDALGAGVLAGQHTDALLSELGFSTSEIEQLRASKTVASETA